MEPRKAKVTMEGAAWVAPFIYSFTREIWIERNMGNPYVFKGKSDKEKYTMLGHVWDIAQSIEGKATPGATILNTSKRKAKK